MPADEGPADAELIGRILGGDREQYAVLVERYQARLYRHAFGMVQDADAAADLVQDSFVKAYSTMATCHDRDRFGAWLFRILRNRCTDYLREHRRRDVPLELDGPYASRLPGPDGELARKRVGGVLQAALAALPENQREAFVLKHVEGHSYEEMEELLGSGVSALKMRVARARDALRAMLDAAGYRDPRLV